MKYCAPLLLLTACWSSTPPPVVANGSGSSAPPDGYDIEMARTPCMGMCPIYTVWIHRDGSVVFRGHQGVARPGEHSGTADRDKLAALVTALHSVQFFDMDERGRVRTPECKRAGKTTTCDFPDDIMCSDTSSTIITVVHRGVTTKVVNEHCVESSLDAIEEQIDTVAGTARWVTGE